MSLSFEESMKSINESNESNEQTVTAATYSLTNTSVEETEAPVALAASVTEEFTKSDKYLWYEEYEDDNISTVDNSKTVSVNKTQINLTQESNSQYIPFEMNRYYDGVDLMNMNLFIHYVNAGGYEDLASVINVSYSLSKIRFAWLVSKNATSKKGTLNFEIHAIGVNSKGDEYIWKTSPNGELNVLQSLEGDGVVEPDSSWITSFLTQVNEKVAEAQGYAQEAETSAQNAETYAQNASQAASSAQTTVDNAKTELEASVETAISDKITTALADYYTKTEIDDIIANIDISDQLTAIETEIADTNTRIDNIDGLANFDVTLGEDGKTLTFYNGETVIKSLTIDTSPSEEWVMNYNASVDTKISDAVTPIQTALDEYKVSTDADLASIHSDIDGLPETLATDYYTKTATDELLKDKADQTSLDTINTEVTALKSTVSGNTTNISTISTKVGELEESIAGINTDPSLRYYATYDSNNVYSLIEVNGENETTVSSFTITGGGGGSSESTTITIERLDGSSLVEVKGNPVNVRFNFSSVDTAGDDTGDATATWKVGNSIVATNTISQGVNSFDISPYVSLGSQKITLSVTDSAGTVAVKTWTVRIIELSLESTFSDTITYPISEVSFTYTPNGAIEKTIHFILDGEELGTVVTSSSGLPQSYTIPAQTHGSHLLEVYAEAVINDKTITSNHIFKDIIFYDETSTVPVIGCSVTEFTTKQYNTTNIVYTVYNPKTDNPTVILAEDDKTVATLVLDSNIQTWNYRSSVIGTHTLTITCGETVKTITANIEDLGIQIEPITANLAFDFNPVGYSNNDENRLWSYKDITMTVSDNFDWVNGGYQLDGNGDQGFCVKAGTTATINYNLFEDDARKNGKEFKIIYRTTNVRKSDATFLECQSGTTLIGLQMNVHEAYIKSSVKNLYVPYSEEDIIEFEFNINKDSDIPIVMSYEDGTPGRPMSYTSDYSFTQSSPVPITIGSADCDVWIYRMKAYSASLTDSGILSNFIADARNADEMIDRYSRNQIYDENNLLTPESVANACPKLKVIKIECPHFTNDKKDFVKDTSVECIHTGGDPVLDNWKAVNCYHSGQGTTSNEYGAAGRNLDLLMCFDGQYQNSKITYDENYKTILTLGDGTVYEDGTGKVSLTRSSVPTNYFNIKVNIASSENQNNAILQKRFNDYLPYTSVATKRDSRVKNSMEFVNCVVFLKESDPDLTTHREFQDNEWHFYAIGNIGDSKKTDYSRVNDPNDPKEFVVEIMDNTLPNSTFSGTEEALTALDADVFNEKGTYGFRYEMDGITDEQQQVNITTWKNFYRFVATSTDEEFVSGLKNWFINKSALYMYLFTERYTMIDNRAKNTFWHYSKYYITQDEATTLGDDAQYYTIDDEAAAINDGYRFDFWDYDNDTALGINNSGELTMTYGKEDTDYRTDGDASSGYIFNAAESKFFCRIRDLMHDELASMFVERESQNCWSSDSLITQFDSRQAEFPEELWRLDYVRKYERTYRDGNTRFLEQMMNGRKKYQRRQFERDQEKYMATKYFGTTATSDQIMFRCNTPIDAVVSPDYTLHLTPYSNMYIDVMFGATYRTQIRAKAGVQYDIECPFSTMDDTAVLIYCASQIQSMGDISACYIHDNDFSNGTKLQELIIGNTTEGYSNIFLTNLILGNNRLLEKLDIRNTPNLVQSLNVSGCNNLEELYAEGSGLTGVVFANGGNLRIAHLPAISSFTAKNLSYIEDLQIENFENLSYLVVENTPAINTYEYVTQSQNLTNVRLLGINWTLSDADILDRLLTISGIDGSGYNTSISVLSGKVTVPVVREQSLYNYQDAWPDLEISYETMINQYAVTFKNDDGTILEIQYIDKGSKPTDPVTRTENPIPTPTKESSISTNYTFAGWDTTLTAVFGNLTITATYTETLRTYTIKYVSKGTILQETEGEYGTSVFYQGDTPSYVAEESAYKYYLFTGWDKSGFINGDKIVNALYDSCEYVQGYFDGKELSTMRPVEMYALTKVGVDVSGVESGDAFTFTMGHDYDYDDIESNTFINEKTSFTGSNYIDTNVSVLNIDRDFVFAIDYEFGEGNSTNSTLMQCYKSDGSDGFKLFYNSSNPHIKWGTTSNQAAIGTNREMLVLRHVAGENGLYVYTSNLSGSAIGYVQLDRSKSTTTDSTLVFGCTKADDGAYENFAIGTIYWAKLWYTDLGDAACNELASYIHEDINVQMSGFKKKYLSDGSSKRSSMSFLASHVLRTKKVMNNDYSNENGWAGSDLNTWLNARFYNGLPIQIKQLVKQVKVYSSIGSQSSETSSSDCYIYIPALIEVYPTSDEPYINEDTSIDYMVNNSDRIRKDYTGTAVEYWTRSPNKGYSSYYWYVKADGGTNGFGQPNAEYGVVVEFSI